MGQACRRRCFSNDGRRVFTASEDGTVRVWDTATARELNTLRGHGGWVTSISCAEDGRFLLSSSSDGLPASGTQREWSRCSCFPTCFASAILLRGLRSLPYTGTGLLSAGERHRGTTARRARLNQSKTRRPSRVTVHRTTRRQPEDVSLRSRPRGYWPCRPAARLPAVYGHYAKSWAKTAAMSRKTNKGGKRA